MINYGKFRDFPQKHLDNVNENASNGKFSFASIQINPMPYKKLFVALALALLPVFACADIPLCQDRCRVN